MAARIAVRLDPVTGKKIPPPVSPKPVRMTATRLTKSDIKPPPAPPPSSGTKSAEEELDALTDLLVKNLENTGDPDFFGKLTCIKALCWCFPAVYAVYVLIERVKLQSRLSLL